MYIHFLSDDQIEKLCEIAEESARKHIISKVPQKGISDFTITVDLNKTEALNINIDVEVKLSPIFKNINVKNLVKDSVKAAFEAIEKHLKECECQ